MYLPAQESELRQGQVLFYFTVETTHTHLMTDDNRTEATFPVTGMSCAACAGTVERALASQPGVAEARVNYATGKVRLAYDAAVASPAGLATALRKVGYGMLTEAEGTQVPDPQALQARAAQAHAAAYGKLRAQAWGAGLFALPVFVIGMFGHHWPEANWWMLLFTVPVLWFGRRFFVQGLGRLHRGQANMDTLVALSAGAAFGISVVATVWPSLLGGAGPLPVYYESAAVVLAFVLLGKVLEERAKAQAGAALRALLELAPPRVLRRLPDGRTEDVPVAEVEPGDALLAQAGQRIAVDGKVLEGQGYIDEASLTGEPVPVAKHAADDVWAGTLTQSGSLVYRAERVGQATVLAGIVRAVEEAQGSKAPVQRLADRVSAVFVPVVLALAALTLGGWLAWGGAAALPLGMQAALAVLVVACPCALGLATPTALLVASGKGARAGIVVRDAATLERARQVTALVIDKTGTLTQGRPAVASLLWAPDLSERTQAEALAKLLALEQTSRHPLAEAVVHHLQALGVVPGLLGNVQPRPGLGVQARGFAVGNARLVAEMGLALPATLAQAAAAAEAQAQTTAYILEPAQVLGLLTFADPLRPDAAEAVRQVQDAGIEVFMLTGDQAATAQAVAQATGIANVQAGLLPADKGAFVQQLQAQGHVVAMAGDGINDAEALARADVSLAMGTGSDVAIGTAGLTLLGGDLRALPKAIRLSRLTHATIRRNLAWAFGYNLLALPVAAGALYPATGQLLSPMWAGAAMAFSSVSVVASSLWLGRQRL